MSVSNGQRANAQTFNDAFLSRTTDSDTVAIIGLNHPSSGGLIANAQQKINDNTSAITSNDADISDLYATKQDLVDKGVANGYASLDGTGKVPLSQIPEKFASIEGNWDASTNTPSLADGVGDLGEIYVVSVAGTQDLGSGSQTFDVGDWVLYNSANEWKKVINSTAVTSVNGQTGAVSLSLDDMTDVDLTTTPPVNGQALVYDGTDWVPGAGGGGEGRINYVQNSDAEIDTSLWLTYDDGAVGVPVDGNGGSPSATTISSVTAVADRLRGTKSFSFAKSAVDGQGEGFAHDCAIVDTADLGRRLQVSFDYKMIGATPSNYADGDVKVYVYDSDNSVLVGAVENDDGGDILFSEEAAVFTGWFTSKTSANNYRLIFHITSTNATAWEICVDNIFLGPIQSFTPVTPLKDWEEFPLTINGLGTGTYTGTAFQRRVGDSVEINFQADFTANGSGSTGVEIELPSGLTIDAAKLPSSTVNFSGRTSIYNIGSFTGYGEIGLIPYVASNAIRTVNPGTGSYLQGANVNSGDQISGTIVIPIEGWSATNLVSNIELTQKTLFAESDISVSQNLTSGSWTTIIFDTEIEDEFGVYDSSTGIFTASRDGLFMFNFVVGINPNSSGNRASGLRVNGTTLHVCNSYAATSATYGVNLPGFQMLRLSKGDTVEMQILQNSGSTISTIVGAANNYLNIASLPDFSTYGVTGKVEYLSATSATKTPVASGDWFQMTGNSVPLTAGTWVLHGLINYSRAASPVYTAAIGKWAAANGADSGVEPANLSIQAGSQANGRVQWIESPGVPDFDMVMSSVRVTVTQDTDVYLVPYAAMTTPANARVVTHIYAERIV